MGTEIDDASIVQRLDSLSPDDRAASRTNPFAVAVRSGELVTADEVRVASREQFAGGFSCPKCKGEMRHYVAKAGTPFFAHVSSRGSCPVGNETPSHLCIKRGLHSVGFDCEVTDESSGYRWDARHGELGVVAEIVCSGLDRYRAKISHTEASGTTCWWVLDSASPGLCSRWGSERICLSTFAASGTVVVENLFQPKVHDVFSMVGNGRLFVFYLGLMWRSVGGDKWQLLDQGHALSQAAVAEDGIKHLMVKMHQRNAHVVIENKRQNIDRKTWFDKKFRFRGEFSMTWSGDRDYVLEMVRKRILDLEDARSFVAKSKPRCSSGSPAEPVHANAEDIVFGINQRHSASMTEIAALRQIAEQSRVTRSLSGIETDSVTAAPLVLDSQERQAVVAQRKLVSSRWGSDSSSAISAEQKKRLNAANRVLLEIAADRSGGGMPSYYLGNY